MLTEKEILHTCKINAPEGQRLLYVRYAPLLKGICLRYINDKEDASDVLQDAFIKIFKKIDSFKEEGSLEGWLKRLVVNMAIDYLQSKKSHISLQQTEVPMDLLQEEEEEEDGNIILKIIKLGFTKEMLVALLHELPQHHATVFNLFYIDELSHKEIAKLMGITEVNSRKLAYRAKDQVRNLLIKRTQYSQVS